MRAYYNEHDPRAAAWLRELMRDGLIPEGEVDERDIRSVVAADLAGYGACHFFAGIGGWAHALRLAGWPDDRPVWTGSCPCQPFSSAGKRQGTADERHLWPEFHRLIAECRPPVIFGEQVASAEVVGTELEAAFVVAVRRGDYARANKLAKRLVASQSFHFHPRWVDGVRADLEAEGYTVGFPVLGAHSAGAPHIRQRLFWVADADHGGRGQERERGGLVEVPGRAAMERVPAAERGPYGRVADAGQQPSRPDFSGSGAGTSDESSQRRAEPGGRRAASGCSVGGLGDASGTRPQERTGDGRLQHGTGCTHAGQATELRGDVGGLGDADRGGLGQHVQRNGDAAPNAANGHPQGADAYGPSSSFWSDSILIPCRDGKHRRIPRGAQPGVQRMADGLPESVDGGGAPGDGLYPLAANKIEGRVGLLRGFGNAIVPQVAAEFVRAYLESTERAG